MNKIFKSAVILSIIAIFTFYADISLAQTQGNNDNISNNATTTEPNEIPEEIQVIINEDENITANDLEIKEPTLLPGNPFYFLKNIGRTLKSSVTFSPIKKAELKLRFTNERFMEIQKIAESNNDPKLLEKALDKYGQELKKIKETTEKIGEKNSEKNETFLNKFIDNQIKHQKLLEKIGEKVPKEVFEKIQENQQIAIQTLSDVPLMFISADRFQEKIEERMENQSGSDFKNFRNLEILKELEGKVPDAAKNAIKRAQENTFKRLNEKIEEKENTAENFTLYIKHIGGDTEKHMDTINNLETINDLRDKNASMVVKNALEKAREINIGRIKNKIERMEMDEKTEETTKNTDDEKYEKTATFQQSSKEQIEKAALMIEKAKVNFESAKNNSALSDKLNSASILIKNAQIHLEKARMAYVKESFGEAFGQSNAAMHNANNAIGIIAKLEINKNSEDEKDNDSKNEDEDENIEDETNNNDTTKNDDPTTIIDKEQLCAQVITPAKNQKTGECREFPTACIPHEWYKVRACEKNQTDPNYPIRPVDKNSNTNNIPVE